MEFKTLAWIHGIFADAIILLQINLVSSLDHTLKM